MENEMHPRTRQVLCDYIQEEVELLKLYRKMYEFQLDECKRMAKDEEQYKKSLVIPCGPLVTLQEN